MYRFMIKHVIMAWMREQQRRRDLAKQIGHFANRRLIENQVNVRLVQAVIFAVDLATRSGTLAIADRGNFRFWQSGGTAIAVGDRGDMNLPTGVGQPNQS